MLFLFILLFFFYMLFLFVLLFFLYMLFLFVLLFLFYMLFVFVLLFLFYMLFLFALLFLLYMLFLFVLLFSLYMLFLSLLLFFFYMLLLFVLLFLIYVLFLFVLLFLLYMLFLLLLFFFYMLLLFVLFFCFISVFLFILLFFVLYVIHVRLIFFENTIEKLFNWFQCNSFNANASKYHFFLSPYKPVTIKIKESAIESSNSEKLFGVTIDSKLSSDDHITILCRKTSQKLHALSKVASYMSFDKKKIVLGTFITSQFSYCSLVWICHSRRLNNRINNLHERALRIVYQVRF